MISVSLGACAFLDMMAGCTKYSGSYTRYAGNNMVEYEAIDGMLGIDYIVFTGDLEDLNERGFAK